MEEKETDAVLLFDTLYTTNHLQIMKVLLPYLKEEHQKKIAVYIKLNELIYTIQYTQKHRISLSACKNEDKQPPDFFHLCNLITPYCTEDEKKMVDQFMNMKSGLEKYQDIMNLMQMLEPLSSFDNGTDRGNLNNLLKNFLTDEQLAMFEMFQEGGNL